MPHILMFLKFGKEKDLKDLIKNGTIYMNSLQYFRTIEDEELRGDSYEGVIEIINSLPGDFEIPSIGYKGRHQGVHLKKVHEEILGNIYSLYCISSHGWQSPMDFVMDQKMKKFGSHCVVIKDNVKFLDLITEKLKEIKIKYHHGFIDYYDRNKVNGKITLFEKPLEFEYQKEFRFYLDRDSSDAFKFSVGNIEDIAELMKCEDVIDTLKLVPKDNSNALT